MYTSNEPCGAFTCRSSTLAVLADSDPFHGLLLTVLVSRSDFQYNEPWGVFMCRSSTLAVLADSGPFLRVLLSFGGPGLISTIYEPRGAFTCRLMTLRILAIFWSVSCTITHRFGVPERFPRFTNPAVRLRLCRQHSQFWPILTRFVDYYSSFRGPEAIP